MPAAESRPAVRRFPIACSTFLHEVFCVRMAPTITSNGVRPGHQCCGPNAVNRELKYSSREGSPLTGETSRAGETEGLPSTAGRPGSGRGFRRLESVLSRFGAVEATSRQDNRWRPTSQRQVL